MRINGWPCGRIGIHRDDGQVVYIRWSKRVLILRQESEADGWLRRQLALQCTVRGAVGLTD
jgi:hypothetical protein